MQRSSFFFSWRHDRKIANESRLRFEGRAAEVQALPSSPRSRLSLFVQSNLPRNSDQAVRTNSIRTDTPRLVVLPSPRSRTGIPSVLVPHEWPRTFVEFCLQPALSVGESSLSLFRETTFHRLMKFASGHEESLSLSVFCDKNSSRDANFIYRSLADNCSRRVYRGLRSLELSLVSYVTITGVKISKCFEVLKL